MSERVSREEDLSSKDIIERWKDVWDHLIHWYDVADSKSLGVITINGLLLSFVTLASILDAQTIGTVEQGNPAIFWLLLIFIISVISSVFLPYGHCGLE
jgi:hypothetical protein